jgi:hypothetical protein
MKEITEKTNKFNELKPLKEENSKRTISKKNMVKVIENAKLKVEEVKPTAVEEIKYLGIWQRAFDKLLIDIIGKLDIMFYGANGKRQFHYNTKHQA